MKLSSKYMVFWITVVTVAFGLDYFQVLQRFDLHPDSFIIGVVVGFIVMKVAPDVHEPVDGKDTKNLEK